MLYHVSDRPGIVRFEPRPRPNPTYGPSEPVVWAVDEEHLPSYLLPRDCPRVTFYALPESAAADVDRLLAGTAARRVVAVESGWLPAILDSRLYLYRLPAESFEALDPGAGYYVSRKTVVPLDVTAVDDILGALLAHDVELRITPSLWRLWDAVVASTLQYSGIRLRNARPREDQQIVQAINATVDEQTAGEEKALLRGARRLQRRAI